MNNVYSLRIPTRNVQSVLNLKSLVEHDGKQVPADKEIRISDGKWKTKELPGAGTSSARTRHLNAALRDLPTVWKKDLNDRRCSWLEADIYKAIFGEKPGKVTAGPLRQLITVLEAIDKLETDTKLPKNRGAELLAHVVSDALQLKVLPSLEARLKEAARILVAEGSMTSARDAWARSGVIKDAEVIEEREFAKTVKSPAREHKPHTPQPVAPARTESTPSAKHVVVHNASPAAPGQATATRILKIGVDPVFVATSLPPGDIPAVLESIHHRMADLKPFTNATEAEKLQWQRAAAFLEAVSGARPTEVNMALFADVKASLDRASMVNATLAKARQAS